MLRKFRQISIKIKDNKLISVQEIITKLIIQVSKVRFNKGKEVT